MKDVPFDTPTRHPCIQAKHRTLFEEVKREAGRRFRPATLGDDGRRGFGTVYARGRLFNVNGVLSGWDWRYADADQFPTWLDASCFVDDPLGVPPTTSFATRAAVASAFANAANAVFSPADGEFVARPLEVVVADAKTPAGIHRGDDADVLAVDLMIGRSSPAIIDAMVRDEFESDHRRGNLTEVHWLRRMVWHRVGRLNAARAMFDTSLPEVKVPGLAPLRRRLEVLDDAWCLSFVQRSEQ